jgi:hypothetical protein
MTDFWVEMTDQKLEFSHFQCPDIKNSQKVSQFPVLKYLIMESVCHSSSTDQPTIPTLHNPKPLQSLTQAPSTTTTEVYQNTKKDHKKQQPSHCFLHSVTHPTFPPPTFPFSATLSASPNFYS